MKKIRIKIDSPPVKYLIFGLCTAVIIVGSIIYARVIVNSDLPEWVKFWLLTAK